jgi:hypothetical protein
MSPTPPTYTSKHVATREYPDPQVSFTLNDLIRFFDETDTILQQDFHRRLASLGQARHLERVPIVGVCGTVNSGKSTIVSGFLSESGVARVLVGELDKEGTHRFAFWLPASWRDNGLGEIVAKMIETATGIDPEDLAENPQDAALQYNAARDRAHEFNIPLIAYDPRLDEAGIAFLDCPDTQRSLDEESVDFTANLRLERLRTIAPMCSAFVVVASMQQKGTEEMGKVFKAIAGSASEAPLYFVLNMTKTDEEETYLPEANRTLAKWGMTAKVRRCYLSPTIRPDTHERRVKPVVTSMDEDRVRLERLAEELDPAELQRRHRLSCANHLNDLLDGVANRVRKQHKEDLEQLQESRDKVCAFLSQKLIDADGHPRALEFTEAARHMAESIQRTAPIGIRIAQAPGRWLRDLTSKWKRRDATDGELERFAQIKQEDFSQFLLGSRFLRPEVTAQELNAVWNQAFDAVIVDGKKLRISPHELDEMTQRLWDDLPFGKKIALFKNVIIATSAMTIAGLLLPFDGGASIILVSKAHLILGGAEILGILVGGPLLATLLSSKGADRLVAKFEQECARPQIDALYAGLADGLGIPRELGGLPKLHSQGKECHVIAPSNLHPLPNKINVIGHPLICLDEPAWEEMIEKLISESP